MELLMEQELERLFMRQNLHFLWQRIQQQGGMLEMLMQDKERLDQLIRQLKQLEEVERQMLKEQDYTDLPRVKMLEQKLQKLEQQITKYLKLFKHRNPNLPEPLEVRGMRQLAEKLKQQKDELIKAVQLRQLRSEFLKQQRIDLLEKLTTWINWLISQPSWPQNEVPTFLWSARTIVVEPVQIKKFDHSDETVRDILQCAKKSLNNIYISFQSSFQKDDINSVITMSLEDYVHLYELILNNLTELYMYMYKQGTYNHFLLEGRGLEYWKIILLAAGDVERNPGPRRLTEEELNNISNKVIGEDSLHAVFDEVFPVSSKWLTFCSCLGLRASLLEAIAKDHPSSTSERLFDGLKHWIRKNYNTEKHGLPTWRKLVEAVDNSSGGENHALALEIAMKHKNSNASLEAPAHPSITNSVPMISDKVSKTFADMCYSITRLLGKNVDVYDLKLFLGFLVEPDPQSGHLKRCIDPGVYEVAASTEDVLQCLCPKYINPVKLLVLEGIVEKFGSSHCKRLLTKYKKKYC